MEFTAIQMAQAGQKAAEAEANELRAQVKGLQADLKGARSHLATSRTSNAELMADRERDKNEIIKLDRDVAIARDQRDHAEKEREAATSNRLREALALIDALNAQNKELQADSIALHVANHDRDTAMLQVAAMKDELGQIRQAREVWRAEERKLRDELARINRYATAWLAYERIDLTISDVIEWKLERDYHVAHDQLDAWFAKLQRLRAIAKSAREAWGEAEEAAQAAWFKDELVAKR